MPIVTLTTDLGEQDYTLPALKGSILSRAPHSTLVDVSHRISNFDIVQAAFVFGNAWKNFPEGTIHVVWVNNYYAKERAFLAIRYDGHYFIGPDNGVFSLIMSDLASDIYRLEHDETGAFLLRDLYAFAVSHIASGMPFEQIGVPMSSLLQRITFRPVTGPSVIRGSVVFIDNFDNVIINISRELFDAIGNGRAFRLEFKRHEPLRKLCRHYSEVRVGEPLCLFNAAGYLEIAVYMGKAATLLGLELDDMVEINFTER